jgi:predicted nucleotidyltransferase
MPLRPSSGSPREGERFLVEARTALSERPEVAAAYLYGSAARGDATTLSDLDVAILPVEGLSESARAVLQRELLTRLGAVARTRSVDVRFFDELPLTVRGRVLYEGILVVDRDPSLRVRTEVRSRMEYHDFQYLERAGTAEWVGAVRERLRGG